MSKRLSVRNLSYKTTEEGLTQAFASWGPTRVTLAVGDQGQPRGFGFVELAEDDQARLAVAAMNGRKLDGLHLMVRPARPPRQVLGCSRRAADAIRRRTNPGPEERMAALIGPGTMKQ